MVHVVLPRPFPYEEPYMEKSRGLRGRTGEWTPVATGFDSEGPVTPKYFE